MSKLTITSATNYDKKKDGQPIIDNKGIQKYRSVIKTVEKGEEFLSGFTYAPLQAGQVIEADIKIETFQGQDKMVFNIKDTQKAGVSSAQANSETTQELKNHTVLLKQILNAAESMSMSLATHQTIESMNKRDVVVTSFDEENIGEFPTEALPVLDEEDFGNPFA